MSGARTLIALLFVGSATAWRVAAAQSYDDLNAGYDSKYHFVRVRYDGGGGGFGGGDAGVAAERGRTTIPVRSATSCVS